MPSVELVFMNITCVSYFIQFFIVLTRPEASRYYKQESLYK